MSVSSGQQMPVSQDLNFSLDQFVNLSLLSSVPSLSFSLWGRWVPLDWCCPDIGPLRLWFLLVLLRLVLSPCLPCQFSSHWLLLSLWKSLKLYHLKNCLLPLGNTCTFSFLSIEGELLKIVHFHIFTFHSHSNWKHLNLCTCYHAQSSFTSGLLTVKYWCFHKWSYLTLLLHLTWLITCFFNFLLLASMSFPCSCIFLLLLCPLYRFLSFSPQLKLVFESFIILPSFYIRFPLVYPFLSASSDSTHVVMNPKSPCSSSSF